MTLEFLLTSLVVVASPGAGVLVTVATGLSSGARAALFAAVGCTLGILPHMLAAITGLAVLLHSHHAAFAAIKYAGAVYLLYLAWSTLKAHGPLSIEADGPARSAGAVVWQAVWVNMLNPKLSIFFLAFLPQFVPDGAARPTELMLELSGVFMAMTLVVFAGYGVFAARVRAHVLSRAHVLTWLRRGFAAAFIGLGIKLLLVQR